MSTEVQAGPLYRVEGSSLSISCKVSGLTPSPGASNDFEFRVRKPTNPNLEYNIISTKVEDFAYAVYGRRVRNEEITLKHVDPNSVVFEIQNLEKTDEGDYECSVINPPDASYLGTYNGITTVKVIDNSLSVSSSAPASLIHTEGDALSLSCQVSSSTVQHTHLSFTWFLRKNPEDTGRPLISMDRDFTLMPGEGFEERYKAGLIRLDKIGEVTYRLKMSQLQMSDQGALYCEAQEWIQDPDRSWYSIALKAARETHLTVKAKEVVTNTSLLVVAISVPHTTLQEGQQLSVSCTLDTQNLKEKFFSIAWLHGGVELARIGPTGVLSVGPEYSDREKEGELRATRIGNGDYRLILQPVRTNDQGEYICRAWPQDRSRTGDFIQGAAQDSKPQNVIISATESGLSVEMTNTVNVNEGDKLELSCKVSGYTGQLSVTWQHKSTSPDAPFTGVISLSQEGVMEKSEVAQDVKVKALRPAPDLFTMEIDNATQSDSGVYQCTVSEWKTNSKASSRLGTANVTVTSLESFVKVLLTGRNNRASVGQEVELICRVRGLSLPRTLSWSLRRDSQNPDSILTLYSDGTISWFGDQHRYQLKINKNGNEFWYHLISNSVSEKEAGNYQCSVSVFLENAPRKLRPSNELAVSVKSPVSDLSLTSPPSIRAYSNTDIELKCSVSSQIHAVSRYAITWLLQQKTGNKTIVKSDQDALVTFGTEIEPNQRQRISVSRTKGPSFVLTIRQAQTSDKGLYICLVDEWQQNPGREWHKFPPISKSTQLTITEPASGLSLNKTAYVLNVKEGEDVQLDCNLITEVASSFFYKVIWLYSRPNASITNVPLVELDHMGLLRYPAYQDLHGLQQRLRLLRPMQSSFQLGVQRAHVEDSGTYVCQVEQYHLDQKGLWQQKASAKSSPITLNVNVTGRNLFIVNSDMVFNISTSQSLTIPCNITEQSSRQSVFQVTWFWQKEADSDRRPIFTAYRNSTLQYWFEKRDEQLRFGHPLPNHYSLTLLKPNPADSGRYFCEVEEWVPSLSHDWRRVAVERSGYLTASVYTEGGVEPFSEPECNSNTWIGVFVGVSLLLLLVIVLLVLKMCRRNSPGGKTTGSSLWTEHHQLNPKDRN